MTNFKYSSFVYIVRQCCPNTNYGLTQRLYVRDKTCMVVELANSFVLQNLRKSITGHDKLWKFYFVEHQCSYCDKEAHKLIVCDRGSNMSTTTSTFTFLCESVVFSNWIFKNKTMRSIVVIMVLAHTLSFCKADVHSWGGRFGCNFHQIFPIVEN